MSVIQQVSPAVAVTAAVSVLVAAGLGMMVKWRAARLLDAAALGAAVGYASGHVYVTGGFVLPPADTINWLPMFALVAALAGVAMGYLRSQASRAAVAAIGFAGAFRLLLQPKFHFAWSGTDGWTWVAALALAVLMITWSLDRFLRRVPAWGALTAMMIAALGTGGALMLSGSFVLGQFGLCLAVAQIALLIGSRGGREIGQGTTWTFGLLLCALIASGYFFAELPAASAMLLGAGPGVVGIRLPIAGGRWASGTGLMLVGGAVIAALWLAWRASPPLVC